MRAGFVWGAAHGRGVGVGERWHPFANWQLYPLRMLSPPLKRTFQWHICTQATVIELYDATPRDLAIGTLLADTLSGSSKAAGSETALSSFSPPALEVRYAGLGAGGACGHTHTRARARTRAAPTHMCSCLPRPGPLRY